MLGTLESLPEADDNQENGASMAGNEPGSGIQTPSSFVSPVQQQTGRERLDTPPVAAAFSSFSFGGAQRTSASPVSSLGSASQFAGSTTGNDGMALGFDSQLKISPFMHDLMDRLVRCEYNTREIQHDLVDIQRKVNLLLERALTTNSQQPGQPEFKDPFAATTNGNALGSSISQPRPSIGNIAPNQQVPAMEDVQTINQRLNALTTSVGQLFTLQTQQMQQAGHPLEARNSIIGLGPPQDIAPHQLISPSTLSPPTLISHTLSNRPDLRPAARQQPNTPLRTWSSGTLDMPIRASESAMSRQEPVLRDKSRRSVSGLLRRDSSGVIDTQGDYGNRDSGPIVTKWDQLQLASELLRSLNKFGVGPPNKIQQRALPFLLKGADIIAQAPPTQERIAAYVIPAIQTAVTNMRTPQRGPIVIMVSTTVDQATQAQRMIRDLGGPIGVRSALGVGTTIVASDLAQELRLLQQNIPHIICGTPQKLHALFTTPGGLVGSEVRFLVLDEVDQLIARNLHDFVFNIVKLLPPPRSRPISTNTPSGGSSTNSLPPASLLDAGVTSSGRRLSTIPGTSAPTDLSGPIERQTALFSNTVPQDVLNLASAIHLKEPVRVLVRRDGNNANPETSQGSRGLRQFYLYLAFTAGSRGDPAAVAVNGGGLGIIGSGRGGATSAETAQAREWKLDALADLCDDIDVGQVVVHVGGMATLDAVVYKLASRGLDAVPLHADMNNGTKLAAINKFRSSGSAAMLRQSPMKVLVVYDVQVKAPEVPLVPLVINYDLPKAVEEYAHRVAPAMATSYGRAGVVINFVTATGGDVEMLRSIECHYKIKCPEVPLSPRDIFLN